jgi:hypothetical protein
MSAAAKLKLIAAALPRAMRNLETKKAQGFFRSLGLIVFNN